MSFADVPSPSPSPSTGDDCLGKDKTTSVKVLIIMAFVAMFLLHVLGSLRRRLSNSLLHATVIVVYTLSYPLVSYTIGWMNSSDWYYDDFAVWAVLLVLLLGSTDGLTALRLGDIDNWKSIYVKHIVKGILVAYVVVYFLSDPDMRYLRCPLTAIMAVGVLKWYLRIASMRMASTSHLSKNVKVISEYMQRKENHLPGPGLFDPVTMQGYRYMVAGERYCVVKQRHGRTPWYQDEGLMAKVTTVEQIWQCTGNLLHLEQGTLLKDVCLSMALSQMLNRRFAGFKLTEAGLEKTHGLVFKGLLLAGGKPYQRAFRVIEDELAFVHDMYFTRYYYLYQKGRYLGLCLPIVTFALFSWLTYLLIKNPDCMVATILITVVLALLEAYQLYLYIASGWFKVALIQSYVCTPSLQRNGCSLEKVISFLLRLKSFRPWKDRLGQYCILRELGRKNRLRSCLHYATLGLVDKARKGRQNSVKLSQNVKKAIVHSLLGSNGYLTNGVTSLRNNGVHAYLSWACDNVTATDGAVTRTILLWHIATTLCWQQYQDDAQPEGDDAVTTASTLSQYCMHLLVFAPNLLPDHSSVSEAILDDAIVEAGELLKGANTLEQSCWKLMEIVSTRHNDRGGHEAPLVAQGAQLAGRLIFLEPTKRWKVLSDFWAEMMLYVSPSDDARAHLEALAKGGEFITHLWTLLTHAGVLKRGPSGAT